MDDQTRSRTRPESPGDQLSRALAAADAHERWARSQPPHLRDVGLRAAADLRARAHERCAAATARRGR